MPSSTLLTKPLYLNDGRRLRTLADAGEMVLSLTPQEQAQPRWQAVTNALVAAIESGRPEDAVIAASRLERTLSEPPFGSVRLGQNLPARLPVKQAPKYEAIVEQSSEFVSMLLVVLMIGVIALATP